MTRLAVLILLVCAAPASASDLLVVGRTDTLHGPKAVPAGRQRVTVGGHRCTVGARTPLAALLASGLKLSLRDYGVCSKRPADAAGLYVRGVAGETAHGADGWVYKLGHRVPSTGAGDLASRTRGPVLWFWCRTGETGCQRTLDTTVLADAGGVVDVRVRAYDDHGMGIAAAGATVTVGAGASAVAGADGVAHVPLGAETGTLDVVATQAKRVRSFGDTVRR